MLDKRGFEASDFARKAPGAAQGALFRRQRCEEGPGISPKAPPEPRNAMQRGYRAMYVARGVVEPMTFPTGPYTANFVKPIAISAAARAAKDPAPAHAVGAGRDDLAAEA
jgi:hypothetical protein